MYSRQTNKKSSGFPAIGRSFKIANTTANAKTVSKTKIVSTLRLMTKVIINQSKTTAAAINPFCTCITAAKTATAPAQRIFPKIKSEMVSNASDPPMTWGIALARAGVVVPRKEIGASTKKITASVVAPMKLVFPNFKIIKLIAAESASKATNQ